MQLLFLNHNKITKYFDSLNMKMRDILSVYTDESVASRDLNELANHIYCQLEIEPLSLYMEEISPRMGSARISIPATLNRGLVDVDGYEVFFHVSFTGDIELFKFHPSKWHLHNTYSVDMLIKGDDNKSGIIIYRLEYTKQSLVGKDNLDEFVKAEFDKEIKDLLGVIDKLNGEVNEFNENLYTNILSELNIRKKRYEELVEMSMKMRIPLKNNPLAPSTIPIRLKPNERKKPIMPSTKSNKPVAIEYSISDLDYENIRNIINLAGIAFEKSAKTFSKLHEEELRDVILSHLNSHYLGIATAETFSRIGKSDIYIPFKNIAAFIAECKMWNGEEDFAKAIEQLFGYTTWRDVKTSLIIFSRKNKDFFRLLETIDTAIKSQINYCTSKKIQKNEWLCQFKKAVDDMDTTTVQIIVFDLHI